EKKYKLIDILAENIGKLQDHLGIQKVLANLPLVWCGDELFLPAHQVYFDFPIIHTILGTKAHTAKVPFKDKADSIKALHEWLGVTHEPRPLDIVSRIKDISSIPPTLESFVLIEKIFGYLANN